MYITVNVLMKNTISKMKQLVLIMIISSSFVITIIVGDFIEQ